MAATPSRAPGTAPAARPAPALTRSAAGGAAELYWEDLTPGRTFDLGEVTIDADEMVEFAQRFDPQWYHVDHGLAADSPYGGLIASGFFTVSLFMRAYFDGMLHRAAAAASPGMEELRWLAPIRAGDRLAVVLEVLDQAPSQSKPDCGTVTLQGTMIQLEEDTTAQPALRIRFRGWFHRRGAAPPEQRG